MQLAELQPALFTSQRYNDAKYDATTTRALQRLLQRGSWTVRSQLMCDVIADKTGAPTRQLSSVPLMSALDESALSAFEA